MRSRTTFFALFASALCACSGFDATLRDTSASTDADTDAATTAADEGRRRLPETVASRMLRRGSP